MRVVPRAMLLAVVSAALVAAQPPRRTPPAKGAKAKAAPTVRTWKYWTKRDEMSPATIHWASIQSENTVNFSFPYNGSQRATLYVRGHPKTGLDAAITIERGQFTCMAGINCALAVRFDEGEPESYQGISQDDYSTTSLFIADAHDFLAKLQRSQRVRIQANIYQEGAPVFTFRVAGYDSTKVPR